ncbi:hybrid sensor histidine kinase/response regulator transcription factor [Chryseosolibacter indicus]|uniref:histidine kinase n=1 Tax=Chryseosolibacter indicus TaxID=2782351 RepID=A0ABS5VMD4_9BACT|nr:hybrid sensor histidine kinase/response regulator transcription factor [Chryseosolibacter indicus]MBT1702173.1 response regulator [Chryseosolibacter indicus]
MIARFLFWLFIYCIVAANTVIAQTAHYQFRQLDVDDGLSHNQVTCFLKDKKGFLWIGTFFGLNRFDGYSIKNYLNDPQNTTSISNNSITSLFEMPKGEIGVFTAAGLNIFDPNSESFSTDLTTFYQKYQLPEGIITNVFTDGNKNIWFSYEAGLARYNATDQTTSFFRHGKNSKSISTDSVSAYAKTGDNSHWIIHKNGILEKIQLHEQDLQVTFRNDFLNKLNKNKIYDYQLLADSKGGLWIYIRDDPQGLYFFNPHSNEYRHFQQTSREGKLTSNFVSGIVEGPDGSMWLSTDHGGVNIINRETFSVSYVLNHPEDDRSISQNSVNTIYRDNEGIIWLGTFKKGISYYHENLIRFPLFKHYPLSTTGLPYGDVNRFAEDEHGNLWIGTNGGGLIYFDRKRNTYRQFLHDPNDPNSISSNVIVSLCMDHQKKLWIGTYYGGLNVYDGKKFIHYKHDPSNPESISDQNIWEIFEDSRNRIWIGTIHGGLNLYDRATNTFSHYRKDDVNSVQSNYIASISEDRDGNLWFGTSDGIDMLERASGRFFHYARNPASQGSLTDNNVFDIKEDKEGRIWVATRNGLNLFDKKTKTFGAFREKQGLPHNTVLTILEDDYGSVWVSTSNGLSRIINVTESDTTKFQFRNYDEADGLQGKQFNENAAFKTSNGELIFGGANGFNIFDPAKFGVNKNPPKVILSDFQVYNRSIKVGEKINGNVLLPVSITDIQEITLPPGQNVFSIEFTGLNFFNPEKNKYEYILKGFHTQWLEADSKSRKVTFTNLNPGAYTFVVKASNNDGIWNKEGVSVRINVLPPFWKTRTAFVLYTLAIISALLITRKLIQKGERLKFDREQERKEAIRMHELDLMKIRFFTNVSHEFRTPLTLILTPLEKMIRQAKEPEQLQQYQLIQRNAKRLLNLVNQLLDFRKLEVQEMKLNSSEGDIIKFIEETVYSFSDLSEKKDIKLSFVTSVPSLETLFDQDKLEKVLFNLLSNAFKFTPEHGSVSVIAEVKENQSGKTLEIKVQDTGIGIEEDKLDKIFDRFFQNELPKTMVNQGSGIGLSITKEFVKIHGGTIDVKSELGKGTCFTVTIPVTEVLHHPEEIANEDLKQILISDDALDSKKPVILLVEDSEDFRFYLKDNLKADYRIVEAKNGNDGWKQVLDTLPDLIVSDIMMPEMNGIELCRKIKADQRVSHTPVILLTARSSEEQKLEGFESGADDYITKPFNFEILVSRIRNLIAKREKLHRAFPSQLHVKASELKITSLDEKFIQKAVKCVEDHIADPDFSVEDLSHELGISRAHFYKKVMSLTGKTPLEFIRMIRLQQAAQLLKKSQLTVAEIAYKVGFNNPKYFARYFKEEYKVLPSVYASKAKK